MFARKKPQAACLGRHDVLEAQLIAAVQRALACETAVELCAYRTYSVSEDEEFPGRKAVSPRFRVSVGATENDIRMAVQKVLEYRSAMEQREIVVDPVYETASA